jgi:alpha-1,2-mannosyltransferase
MPLAALPYAMAYGLWVVLLLAIHVATWHRAFGGTSAAFWAAMSATGVYVNVMHGQNGLLNASLVGLCLLMLHTRPLLAGILLGALCYKPQIGLPIGVLLLATGQWRAVLGAALSVALLCGASALVLGIDVWRAFVANAAATQAMLEDLSLPLGKLGTVFSFARLLGLAPAPAYVLQGLVAIVALTVAIRAWRRPGERVGKLAVAAAMVPLVPPYLFDYDFVILALPIGLLLTDGFRNGWLPWTRTVLLVAWLAPGVAPAIADATSVQIMPLASLALFWVAWRRCMRARQASDQSSPCPDPAVARPAS